MFSTFSRVTVAGMGAVALCLTLGISPASAATSSSEAAASTSTDMVTVSKTPKTITYFNEELGETITTTGVETVTVDAATAQRMTLKGTTANSSIQAAGCAVTHFLGNPTKRRQSTAPYTNYVTGTTYSEASAGCTYGDGDFIRLREDHGIYKPTIETAWTDPKPGGGRSYAYVDAVCKSGTKYFNEGSAQPYATASKVVC
jgi:hypothetical protein